MHLILRDSFVANLGTAAQLVIVRSGAIGIGHGRHRQENF